MADRTVSVSVSANVNGFVSAMRTAQQATRDFARRSGEYIQAHGDAMREVGDKATVMGAGILAGIGLAVKAWMDFSDRMIQVQVASGATAQEMEKLSAAALTMGTAFGMSAGDVADAQIELGKAGLSAGEMLSGGLAGALGLAAAGQINVSEATEIATAALSQFNLKGKDVPHIADLLAAGANKALGGVDELGQALKQGGLVASSFGVSLDETVGTLAAFAQQGLLGSDAGTSMKTMLIALANPSKEAANKMKELGINAYDAQGNFIGMAGLAQELKTGMGDLTQAQRNQALATIFGTDAIRSANILFKEGAEGIQQWTRDVNDSGYASEAAMKNLDSLNGDVKKLTATFQNGMIQMGAEADGFLRPIVQNITGAIRAFNDLDDPIKGAGLTAAAATGGMLLLGGSFLSLAPRVFDTVKGFKELATSAPRVAGNLGAIGRAAGGVAIAAIALAALGSAITEKKTVTMTEFAAAITNVSSAAGGAKSLDVLFSGNWEKKFNQETVRDVNSLADAVKRLANPPDTSRMNEFERFGDWAGKSLGLVADEAKQLEDRFNGLGEAMGNMVATGGADKAAEAFKVLSDEFQRNGKSAQDALDTVPGYRDALLDLAMQSGVTLEGQDLLDLAMGKVPATLERARAATEIAAQAQEDQKAATEAQEEALAELGLTVGGVVSNLDKFAEGLARAGLSQLSTRDAARQYQETLDAVDESIKKNGASLDINTEAGRANQAALDAVANSGLGVVQAMAKQTDANGTHVHSQGDLQSALMSTYNDLLANYEQFGITGGAADELARSVLGIPKDVPIESSVQNYVDTMLKLSGVRQAADNLNGKRAAIIVDVQVNNETALDPSQYAEVQRTLAPGGRAAFSRGGYVDGMGPRGVDSVPAVLAPGEYVIKADAAAAFGYDRLARINDGAATLEPAPMLVSAPPIRMPQIASATPGPSDFTGNLYLDSGEFLGKVTGIATAVADKRVDAGFRDASMRRRG